MRIALALAIVLNASAALAVEAPFPRHPAPSPDGAQLAFSWQGDVWLAPIEGGAARRLTANPAYDHRPVWARADELLFASDREGADDVYRLQLADGRVSRLSFHESPDVPQGAIGDDAVFVSRRHETWDRMPAVHALPLAGGTERLLARVLALEAVPSPDGKRLALVRGGTPAERRHYRGAANRDLWLLDRASGELKRLTDTAWDEDHVSWAGNDALVFRSDEGGDDRALVRLELAAGSKRVLARHAGLDVRQPRASADGRVVAYELWDAIWTVAGDGSAAPRRLAFDVPADALQGPLERETLRADADEVAVSPDGTQVALVVKGDVFVVARRSKDQNSVAEAPTARVTRTVARERDVAWHPDGRSLVYASDRGGRWELYAARPAGRTDGRFDRATAFDETRLTQGPRDARRPAFSPDGKRLAWIHGLGGLVVAAGDGSGARVLFEHWGDTEFAWSPDSRWLAFSREDQDHDQEVFVVSADGGPETNVSQHPGRDSDPAWSGDGRRLFWLSRRHARSSDLWAVYLTRADDERSAAEWVELFEDEDKKKGDKKDEKADGKKEPRPVAIDLEGLARRARSVTALPGDERALAVSPDGRTVAFVAAIDGERDLFKVRWDGKELTRLTTGGAEPTALAFSKDGKTVFHRTGKGTVGAIGLDGKAADPAPFAARVEHERAALRAQVFDEAWRALDRQFADPQFWGKDWKALRERYRPLALAAAARRDYDEAVNLMLGELNASHMGFRPPGPNRAAARTGALGVELSPAPDGRGVVVDEVLPRTPAARVDVALKPGDRIVAIDGQPVGPRDNVHALLAETAGRRLALRVADAKGERDVTITPASLAAVRDARYETWVAERRAMVERMSGGRLGYVHIQGMNEPSLEEFERDLRAAAWGRQGLLIDVRGNGGGWTTDYLMAILNVKRHAWTLPRDGDPKVKGYPSDRLPLPAWTRPAAALIDSASYSNAEIFAWAFKTLGRGPVIGEPTFGAVMSTGGTPLVDGSFVRLPFRRWYVAGSGIDQERNGCTPDVFASTPPEQDLSKDADDALAKAVATLLATLPADPAQLPW